MRLPFRVLNGCYKIIETGWGCSAVKAVRSYAVIKQLGRGCISLAGLAPSPIFTTNIIPQFPPFVKSFFAVNPVVAWLPAFLLIDNSNSLYTSIP